jgi:hypothetical protein
MSKLIVEEISAVIFELRQYTLRPGRRDELIELFERELIAPQEEAGMRILGQFRDLDDPDRFVWMRSFPDMEARLDALSRFYGGPIWKAHRDAANATMIDSDDVLLLRLVDPLRGLPPTARNTTIYSFARPVDSDAVRSVPSAWFRTEYAENSYPALPVRADDVIVTFAPPAHDVPGLESSPRQLRLEATANSQMR